MKNFALAFTLLSTLALPAFSVENSGVPGLYAEILAADTAFFDAFNRQDLDTVKNLFTRDLEFYHDKGGFLNYQANIEATEKYLPTTKPCIEN